MKWYLVVLRELLGQLGGRVLLELLVGERVLLVDDLVDLDHLRERDGALVVVVEAEVRRYGAVLPQHFVQLGADLGYALEVGQRVRLDGQLVDELVVDAVRILVVLGLVALRLVLAHLLVDLVARRQALLALEQLDGPARLQLEAGKEQAADAAHHGHVLQVRMDGVLVEQDGHLLVVGVEAELLDHRRLEVVQAELVAGAEEDDVGALERAVLVGDAVLLELLDLRLLGYDLTGAHERIVVVRDGLAYRLVVVELVVERRVALLLVRLVGTQLRVELDLRLALLLLALGAERELAAEQQVDGHDVIGVGAGVGLLALELEETREDEIGPIEDVDHAGRVADHVRGDLDAAVRVADHDDALALDALVVGPIVGAVHDVAAELVHVLDVRHFGLAVQARRAYHVVEDLGDALAAHRVRERHLPLLVGQLLDDLDVGVVADVLLEVELAYVAHEVVEDVARARYDAGALGPRVIREHDRVARHVRVHAVPDGGALGPQAARLVPLLEYDRHDVVLERVLGRHEAGRTRAQNGHPLLLVLGLHSQLDRNAIRMHCVSVCCLSLSRCLYLVSIYVCVFGLVCCL